MWQRVWDDLIARPGGPFSFRLVLQPLTAVILGVLAGLRDAKQGRPAYLWTVITDRAQRRALLREGWHGVARIFVFAFALDVVFQLIELHWFYFFESLIVALVLACVPYALVRGPTNRLARRIRARRAHAHA
jgi:hypothetical protein